MELSRLRVELGRLLRCGGHASLRGLLRLRHDVLEVLGAELASCVCGRLLRLRHCVPEALRVNLRHARLRCLLRLRHDGLEVLGVELACHHRGLLLGGLRRLLRLSHRRLVGFGPLDHLDEVRDLLHHNLEVLGRGLLRGLRLLLQLLDGRDALGLPVAHVVLAEGLHLVDAGLQLRALVGRRLGLQRVLLRLAELELAVERANLLLRLRQVPLELRARVQDHGELRAGEVLAAAEDEGLHQRLHHRDAEHAGVGGLGRGHERLAERGGAHHGVDDPAHQLQEVRAEEDEVQQEDDARHEHRDQRAAVVIGRDRGRLRVEGDVAGVECPADNDHEVPNTRDDPDQGPDTVHRVPDGAPDAVLHQQRLLHQHGAADEDLAHLADAHLVVAGALALQPLVHGRRLVIEDLLARGDARVHHEVPGAQQQSQAALHVAPSVD
mmetsp:Transcript_55231/g.171064  ORF Transcript_55231/g.171064 Transcript_55231/m.171064 type:complete len:438 (+) Transcript_55231:43-1356(+)